ncbi:uncharacterized protein SPSK_06167 [Sporothrix schenckii 1099-18]|uniref:Uncharacterized protein n=2 Tax=Sporothrix schenckii TaxID=29908 RepID=U7PKL2_SPOS1|nr:uncharacterized protein SPSK_06167 [Sporothrix schenckii 1099-18]ERS95274.1 hypothetical protein HMPREF1624_08486 [Sporothrix schenckii ATCC 58251]KJR90082.1 hypothetical protein SPSK_06167 [Sporothrix schenckii 1099-18]
MDVIPIALTDQQKPLDNIRIRTHFVVKGRLDAAALKAGLDKLIREHWRKLGGRLVWNSTRGVFEYHVPQTFTDGYELFTWTESDKSSESIETAVPSLKAPSTTPKEAETVTETDGSASGGNVGGMVFLPPVMVYDAAFRPANWPFHVADDPTDSPILYIHMTLYDDASVLAMSVPHMVTDQMGLTTLVNAWMGVLAGQTPPPLIDDPLPYKRQFADLTPDEARRVGKMHVRRWGEMFFMILGFLFELVFYKEEVDHILFMPHSLVKSVRQRFTAELETYGSDPGISDNDVITAILTKFARLHKPYAKMMTLNQTMNLRGRLPSLTGSVLDGFIHNGFTFASSRFKYKPDMPTSEIAYMNRQSVRSIFMAGEADINLAIAREMVRRKQGIFICEALEQAYTVISWSAAWKGLDLTNAVELKEKEKHTQQGTKPEVFVLGRGGERSTPRRFNATVMFRNDEGYWIDIGCSKKNMVAIQAYMAVDPMLMEI